jgi:hypothetical protein
MTFVYSVVPLDHTVASVEDRLSALEREVAFLKQQLSSAAQNGKWWKEISGSLADYPEFAEVLRLGAEYRRQQRDNEPEADMDS